MPMTYEQHLDEVATLLFELYEQSEEGAIKLVMAAQADLVDVVHTLKQVLCVKG